MKRVLSKSVAGSAAMITAMTAMTMIGVAASAISASAMTTVSAATAQANPSILDPTIPCSDKCPR